jgi:hypothetical protein
LVEEWQGDQTSTTRAEAAVLLAEVLQLHGWTQSDARPALAAVSPVAALEAPGPRRPAAGRSGGDGAGFNGPGKPSSRVGDSRPDPSEAENALRGGSPGPAASDGPGPASSPRTPATATSHPIDQETP